MFDSDTTLNLRDLEADVLSADFNADILEIFCYAAYSVVYILSVYLIVFNCKGKRTPQHKALAGVITVLWALLTMRVGYVWHHVNATYIEHGASREDEFWFSESEALMVFQAVLFYILILLADLIMIWRTWAIYARKWLAVVLPMLTMLTGLVAAGIQLATELVPVGQSRDLYRLIFFNWNYIYFSMIVCTNTLCTVLIIGRIIFLTGWRKALRTYGGIMNILVESAFIYSGAFLIDLALATTRSDRTLVAFSCIYALLPSITCFAPTLVILRVASGHAVTTSVVPSTGVSAPIQFAVRTPEVDLESNAGM